MHDHEFLANNERVIAEYRAGTLTDIPFPVLLLTTTGARTGRRLTSPLGYTVDDGQVIIVGSRAGSDRHPAWFHNLSANPDVTVELDGATYPAKAHVLQGEERDRRFAAACANIPLYATYAGETSRTFPVVVLKGVPVPGQADLRQE